MHEWTVLYSESAGDVSSPSDDQLARALEELFSNPDDEHPDAWVQCGSDDGPLYVISIYSRGHAIFAKYSDADMTEELETMEIPNVDDTVGLALWKNLIEGKMPTAE